MMPPWAARIFVGLVVLSMGLCVLLVTAPPSPEVVQESLDRQARISAEIDCEDAVKRRLVAPATAKFPREGMTWNPKATDSTALVSGNVDAQNSFGALLRQRYFCELRPAGGGTWRVVDMSIGGS